MYIERNIYNVYKTKSNRRKRNVGISHYANWIPRKYHASNSIPCRLNCPYEN